MIIKPHQRALSVVFRTDSSIGLGSGHVTRCMTLAQELRRRGAAVRFICRDLPGNLIARIENAGYLVDRLGPIPDDMNGGFAHARQESMVSQENDATATMSILGNSRPDWIIVDHYELESRWEHVLQDATMHLLVIEDLQHRSHECDVILNQNWYGTDDDYSGYGDISKACLRLTGPRFALLQPEYTDARQRVSRSAGIVKRLLIYFGGTDTTDETGKVLDALLLPEFSHLSANVVIGPNHPAKAGIIAKVKARPGTALHENLPSLANLMVDADLAIGGGGTTSWERNCLSLHSLVTTLAQNQEPITEALAKGGYLHWVGRSTETTFGDYAAALRMNLRNAAPPRPLVDGFGTKRVAEVLLPSSTNQLRLRHARADDAVMLFDWRNEPLVREMSFSGEPVYWVNHLSWFERKLNDPDTELFIAEVDGLPIGQIRLDFRIDEAILSYSVDRLVRGRGWSKWMITEALSVCRRASMVAIRAYVKADNIASRKIFSRLGWSMRESADGNIVFQTSDNRSGAGK